MNTRARDSRDSGNFRAASHEAGHRKIKASQRLRTKIRGSSGGAACRKKEVNKILDRLREIARNSAGERAGEAKKLRSELKRLQDRIV